jgi:hypothetical protein
MRTGIKYILTFNDKDFAQYTDIEAVHPRSISSLIFGPAQP